MFIFYWWWYTHALRIYIIYNIHIHVWTLWFVYMYPVFFRRNLDESGEASRDGTVFLSKESMVSSHVRQIPRRVCFWGLYICWTEPWSYCLVHKFLTSSSLISLKDWNSSLIISKHVELGEYSISGILQSSPNTHPKSMNDQFLISYNANGFQQINISLPLAHIYIYIHISISKPPSPFFPSILLGDLPKNRKTPPPRSSLDFRTSAGGAQGAPTRCRPVRPDGWKGVTGKLKRPFLTHIHPKYMFCLAKFRFIGGEKKKVSHAFCGKLMVHRNSVCISVYTYILGEWGRIENGVTLLRSLRTDFGLWFLVVNIQPSNLMKLLGKAS